jgi:hypothetical protein
MVAPASAAFWKIKRKICVKATIPRWYDSSLVKKGKDGLRQAFVPQRV